MNYKSDISKANRIQEAKKFPEVILIDNANICNLRCSMCDHINMRNHREFQRMDIQLYQKIIDEIAIENPNARVWEIFFGDPFVVRDMAARIKYAKEKGLKDVVVNTNGVLMKKEKAKAVIEAGLDAMYVGIDAAREETYKEIRIGGNFTKVVENVLNYRDLLKTHGTDQQKLYVQFVVAENNENELEEFKNFWRKQKVEIKIRPKVSWAGLVPADNLWDNELVKRLPCYWLMKTMVICADGEIALCAVDVHNRVKCGNLQNATLKQLWQDKLKEYRLMHQENKFHELPQMCQKCSDWQSAYGEFF